MKDAAIRVSIYALAAAMLVAGAYRTGHRAGAATRQGTLDSAATLLVQGVKLVDELTEENVKLHMQNHVLRAALEMSGAAMRDSI